MKTKVQGTVGGREFTEAYRQGEILIFKLREAGAETHPAAKRVANGVIRTGEKEGHQHQALGDVQLSMFPGTMAPTPGETQEQPSQGVLEVGKKGGKIIHPEHGPIKLKPGKYIVQTQKEAVGKNKSQSVKD